MSISNETYNKWQKITLPLAAILMVIGTVLFVWEEYHSLSDSEKEPIYHTSPSG